MANSKSYNDHYRELDVSGRDEVVSYQWSVTYSDGSEEHLITADNVSDAIAALLEPHRVVKIERGEVVPRWA